MRTNIELDDTLVKEAMDLSGMTTKKAVINLALEEYIRAYTRKKIVKYRGKNIWEGNLEEMRTMR